MKRFDVLLTPADGTGKSYKQTDLFAADEAAAIAVAKNYLLGRMLVFEKVSKEEATARLDTYTAEATERVEVQVEETPREIPAWLDKRSIKG